MATRTRRGRRAHRSSAIEIQVAARVSLPVGTTIAPAVIREAIDYRIESGEDPPGIALNIVRWRHPHTREGWREGSEDDWSRFGRLLQHARVRVSAIRHREGESE